MAYLFQMPCYPHLLPYVINIHVLLIHCQFVTAHQRFKRQALPTDHIMVHSFNSNVSIADWVVVISDESKIEFREKFLQGEVWSGNSRLDFESHGPAENFSAQNNVHSIFHLPQAMLQTKCEQIQMILRTNRSTNGHSYVEYKADRDVNLIFSNTVTQVNALGGQWAHITAVTRQSPATRHVSIGSSVSSGLSRQLHIVSVDDTYSLDITLFDAQMQMRYGNITVQMSSDYRLVRLSTGLYTVDFKTVLSPFEMSISDQEMIVQCLNEKAVVRMLPYTSNIIINTDQYSRVEIDRGNGSIILGGEEVRPAGDINLISMQLNILLKSGDISSIYASANRSRIKMQTSSTNMASAASHHSIDIIGGRTDLHINTGNVSIDIIASAHLETPSKMLPPFPTPEDNFHNIGPVLNNISHDLTTYQKTYAPTPNNTTLTVPSSQMAAEHSLSTKNDNFQNVLPGSNLQSRFTVPSFSWITTTKPTATVSSVVPEPISKPRAVSITSGKYLSSTKSIAPSISLVTSRMDSTGTTVEPASSTKSMEHNTNNIPGDTFTYTTYVSSTAGLSVSLSNSSTTPSSTLFTWTSVPSNMLSRTTKTISLTHPSTATSTSLPEIPTAAIMEMSSTHEFEALITASHVTGDTPANTLFSKSTANTGIVLTEEVDSGGGTWLVDENHDIEKAGSIAFTWDAVVQSTNPSSTKATRVATEQQSDVENMHSTTCIEITPATSQNTRMFSLSSGFNFFVCCLSGCSLTDSTTFYPSPEERPSALFTKEPTIVAISEATMEPIIVKTDRSIGSAWTPFSSPPFEFPPTDSSRPTVLPRSGKAIVDDGKAMNRAISLRNDVSQNEGGLSGSAPDVLSVPMVDALKSIFGKTVHQDSFGTKNLQESQKNQRLGTKKHQNLLSSKFKRALFDSEDREMYELQLKVSPLFNLTAENFRQELLLAMKKFVLFTNLRERQKVITSEDATRIKILNMEQNGDDFKVLYTVDGSTEANSYGSDCDPNKVNGNQGCVRNRRFSGFNSLFLIMAIIIVVLFTLAALLFRYKVCGKTMQVAPYLESCYSTK